MIGPALALGLFGGLSAFNAIGLRAVGLRWVFAIQLGFLLAAAVFAAAGLLGAAFALASTPSGVGA